MKTSDISNYPFDADYRQALRRPPACSTVYIVNNIITLYTDAKQTVNKYLTEQVGSTVSSEKLHVCVQQNVYSGCKRMKKAGQFSPVGLKKMKATPDGTPTVRAEPIASASEMLPDTSR